LTVVDPAPDGLLFDVIQQTLDLTSLSNRKVGDRVHLEPAMRVGDAVDGHHVQGHVEACGTVLHNGEDASRGWRLRVEVPPSLMASVVPQGSITLHGVSLTVAHRDETSVEVALIPETLERTNLGHLQVGDPIHVETDVLCRTVVQTVRSLGLTPGSSS
jgi:riboflavin synthase